MKLTTHLHLVPMSSSTPSWRGAQLKKAQGQLYLYQRSGKGTVWFNVNQNPTWKSPVCIDIVYAVSTTEVIGLHWKRNVRINWQPWEREFWWATQSTAAVLVWRGSVNCDIRHLHTKQTWWNLYAALFHFVVYREIVLQDLSSWRRHNFRSLKIKFHTASLCMTFSHSRLWTLIQTSSATRYAEGHLPVIWRTRVYRKVSGLSR